MTLSLCPSGQQGIAPFLRATMRSQLLLSVAHLPTIRETWEEPPPAASGLEAPASPSVDDYVRSIRQLAQPTSVLDEAGARARPRRPFRPAGGFETNCPTGSLLDITARFNGQQPALPRILATDPLDWLFGECKETQANQREPLRRTDPPADSWALRRLVDSGKVLGSPRGRLFKARGPENSPARVSWGCHWDSCTSRHPGRALASPRGSRPSGMLRTRCLQLPVIHEL